MELGSDSAFKAFTLISKAHVRPPSRRGSRDLSDHVVRRDVDLTPTTRGATSKAGCNYRCNLVVSKTVTWRVVHPKRQAILVFN